MAITLYDRYVDYINENISKLESAIEVLDTIENIKIRKVSQKKQLKNSLKSAIKEHKKVLNVLKKSYEKSLNQVKMAFCKGYQIPPKLIFGDVQWK